MGGKVGFKVGDLEGESDGDRDGDFVGLIEVGECEGLELGLRLGRKVVGAKVGMRMVFPPVKILNFDTTTSEQSRLHRENVDEHPITLVASANAFS